MPNFIILRRVPRDQAEALQRELEREWNTRWGRPQPVQRSTLWRPNADVHEHPNAYLIKIELPGMRDAAIEVLVDDGRLLVQGQRPEQRDDDVECVHALGVNYGPFQVAFSFPTPLDEEAITARYDDGFLLIELPKLGPAQRQPRRIAIQVDESKLPPQ